MAEEKITFTDEEGVVVEFTVIEEAMLGGVNYLLVADEANDAEEAYILTEVRSDEGEVVYEVLEDENQLPIIMDYFNALLDDIDLEF